MRSVRMLVPKSGVVLGKGPHPIDNMEMNECGSTREDFLGSCPTWDVHRSLNMLFNQ
jgi:hypothetical protein